MIDFLLTLPGALVMLSAFVAVGIGFWSIGRWLRTRGHGDQLDRIDARVQEIQVKALRNLGPISSLVLVMGRGLSRMPLLGSPRQQRQWTDLQNKVREDRNR